MRLRGRTDLSSLRRLVSALPLPFWLALIFLLALILRVVFVLAVAPVPPPDSDPDWYDTVARNLASGHGFVLNNGEQTAFWPPGYALALSFVYVLFGSGLTIAKLFNAVVGALTVFPTYGIGAAVFGRRTGLIAALLLALCPGHIFWTPILFSEIMFTLLFSSIVWLLLVVSPESSWRRPLPLIGLGLAIGAATLVRAQASILLLVALAYWLLAAGGWRRQLSKLGIAFVAAAVLVLPWTVRNIVTLKSPVVLATNVGYDLYIGHSEPAAGRFRFPDELWAEFGEPGTLTTEKELSLNSTGFRRALEFIAHHPEQEPWLTVRKVYWLFHSDSDSLLWIESFDRARLVPQTRERMETMVDAYYYGMLALALVGMPLWASWRDRRRLLLLLVLVPWFAVHAVFFGEPRFHLPVLPIMMLLAATVPVALWSAGWRRRLPGDASGGSEVEVPPGPRQNHGERS